MYAIIYMIIIYIYINPYPLDPCIVDLPTWMDDLCGVFMQVNISYMDPMVYDINPGPNR